MMKTYNQERAKEDAKISNDFARVAAQTAILSNGGAATAILAFLATIFDSGDGTANAIVSAVPTTLGLYALGVFFGVASLLIALWSIERYMLAWRGEGEKYWKHGDISWRAVLILIGLSSIMFLGASILFAGQVSSISFAPK